MSISQCMILVVFISWTTGFGKFADANWFIGFIVSLYLIVALYDTWRDYQFKKESKRDLSRVKSLLDELEKRHGAKSEEAP